MSNNLKVLVVDGVDYVFFPDQIHITNDGTFQNPYTGNDYHESELGEVNTSLYTNAQDPSNQTCKTLNVCPHSVTTKIASSMFVSVTNHLAAASTPQQRGYDRHDEYTGQLHECGDGFNYTYKINPKDRVITFEHVHTPVLLRGRGIMKTFFGMLEEYCDEHAWTIRVTDFNNRLLPLHFAKRNYNLYNERPNESMCKPTNTENLTPLNADPEYEANIRTYDADAKNTSCAALRVSSSVSTKKLPTFVERKPVRSKGGKCRIM